MKVTSRSFTWEWGFPVIVLIGGTLTAVMWALPWPIRLALMLVYFAYMGCWYYVTRKYPGRADLPEWHDYCQRQRQLAKLRYWGQP